MAFNFESEVMQLRGTNSMSSETLLTLTYIYPFSFAISFLALYIYRYAITTALSAYLAASTFTSSLDMVADDQ